MYHMTHLWDKLTSNLAIDRKFLLYTYNTLSTYIYIYIWDIVINTENTIYKIAHYKNIKDIMKLSLFILRHVFIFHQSIINININQQHKVCGIDYIFCYIVWQKSILGRGVVDSDWNVPFLYWDKLYFILFI